MSDKSVVSQSANKISEHYEENPLTSLLITTLSVAVPQVAIAKDVIDRAVTKIQKERFETLLGELAKGEKLLTPEIIESEEFIHSFVVVYRAVMSTYQREKIRRFANLLLFATANEKLASDKFELYYKILSELTEIEFKVLSTLYNLEAEHASQSKGINQSKRDIIYDNGYQTWATVVTHRIWDEFVDTIVSEFEITLGGLQNILRHAEGLGIYHRQSAKRIKQGEVVDIGTTTVLFDDFKDWITSEDEINEFLYDD